MASIFKPYEGDEPFVFVSYSHQNSDEVLPILQRLHDRGVRLWYDSGITPGSEWPEEIGNHILGCGLFLLFMSPEAAESHNVKSEITMALEEKKPLMNVYLRDTKLPVGLRLQLGNFQHISYSSSLESDSFNKFTDRLLESVMKKEQGVMGTPPNPLLEAMHNISRQMSRHEKIDVGDADDEPDEPEIADEPIIADEPGIPDEPDIAEKPDIAEEHDIAEDTVKKDDTAEADGAAEPVVAEKPIAATEPVVAEKPTASAMPPRQVPTQNAPAPEPRPVRTLRRKRDPASRLREGRLCVTGAAVAFVAALIVCLIVLMRDVDDVSVFNLRDRPILLPIFVAAATYVFPGFISATRRYWGTFKGLFLLVNSSLWKRIPRLWTYWQTLGGAIALLLASVAFTLFAIGLGPVLYVAVVGYTGFSTGIYKIGMSIRALWFHAKELDYNANLYRSKTMLVMVQVTFSICFMLLLFGYASRPIFFSSENIFFRTLDVAISIGVAPAAVLVFTVSSLF